MIINLEDRLLVVMPNPEIKGSAGLKEAQENIKAIKLCFENFFEDVLAFLPNHYLNIEGSLYNKRSKYQAPVAFVSDSIIKNMIGSILKI